MTSAVESDQFRDSFFLFSKQIRKIFFRSSLLFSFQLHYFYTAGFNKNTILQKNKLFFCDFLSNLKKDICKMPEER